MLGTLINNNIPTSELKISCLTLHLKVHCLKFTLKALTYLTDEAMTILQIEYQTMSRSQGFRFDEALLYIFNILLVVIGVATMIISLSTYNENIQKTLASVLNEPDTPINMNYVYYYVNNAIGIGAVLAICGVIGFSGVCCKNKCLLNKYFICMSVALAYSMCAFFFFLTERAKLESSTMVVFQKQLLNKYHAGNEELDKLVDATHIMLQCCGANGCADFEEPPSSCNCIEENTNVGCMKAVGEFVNIVLNSTFVGGMLLLCLEMAIWLSLNIHGICVPAVPQMSNFSGILAAFIHTLRLCLIVLCNFLKTA
ncbi:hypothetical protein T4D_1768 [Trichinella pseudospiralis]|uniref:Uncharacterized protein n=1 Tax=Trichinella pseudospiralis TaxID=6337 RepID=A0A0V1FUM8_TRIPS|nr:hypothetical protein T4D_1768 [Trichinella pseudospiralis]